VTVYDRELADRDRSRQPQKGHQEAYESTCTSGHDQRASACP
jgi:hypothetical protein